MRSKQNKNNSVFKTVFSASSVVFLCCGAFPAISLSRELNFGDETIQVEHTRDPVVCLPKAQKVAFDDIAPPHLELKQSWNSMGLDDQGRVYIGFTSDIINDSREDFAVFRYSPTTQKREFLGSFVSVANTLNNLEPGESIPKGHTRMILADRRLYMGSQGFHDFKDTIDDLQNYRGAHLFVYDIDQGTWNDVASSMSDGVLVDQEGIVALSAIKERNLLIGLTHPHGNLVFYNYRDNTVIHEASGIPWSEGNPISRELVVTPQGNIYLYRGTEKVSARHKQFNAWVYNIDSGVLRQTHSRFHNGFWMGQTATKDGRQIFLTTTNGQLYKFDVRSEAFVDLGHMLPESQYNRGRRVRFQYGPILSPDETKLYFIPSFIDNPKGSGELFEYSVSTGEVRFVRDVPAGVYTAADIRDDSRIYFAHFGNDSSWEGGAGLFILEFPRSCLDKS